MTKPYISIKANIKQNQCRIIYNGRPCYNKSLHRGLCSKHYRELKKDKELFNKAAEKQKRTQKDAIHTTTRYPSKGLCRVIENGEECKGKAESRGLCQKHYMYFSRRGTLEEFAKEKPKKKTTKNNSRKIKECERKKTHEEGVCVIKGCDKPTKSRGLCSSHYNLISKSKERLEELANPVKRNPLTNEKKQDSFKLKSSLPINDICRIIENGKHCNEITIFRGLCKKHYRKIKKIGRLEELAAPKKNLGRVKSG